MIKISVIIPVYNAERYLSDCLNSILKQSMEGVEVICIDDASTDESPEILKKFSDKSPCIHVIRCETNKGQAHARNVGLDASRGKYVYFVDADDRVADNALQRLYSIMQQDELDLICFDAETVCEDIDIQKSGSYSGQRKFSCPDVVSGKKFFLMSVKHNDWQRSVWRQFWRRGYLEENNLKFNDASSPHEDGLFSLCAIWGVKRLRCIPQKLYIYRRHDNTVMTSGFTLKRFKGRFVVYVEELLFLRSKRIDWDDDLTNAVEEFLANEQKIVKKYWVNTFSSFEKLSACYFGNEVYQNFYKKMFGNLCNNLDQLDHLIDSQQEICLYGIGRMSDVLYKYLKLKRWTTKISLYIVSDASNILVHTRHQKSLICIEEYQNKYLHNSNRVVLCAVGEHLHEEIGDELKKRGISSFLLVTDKLWEDIAAYIREMQESEFLSHLQRMGHETECETDVLLLSPPYWDVMSPFSAIPSLVAALKQSGIRAYQMDLGIECFHILLHERWEDVAQYFLSKRYYEKNVVPYRNNPYKTWEKYKESLWFFHTPVFPVHEVKERYSELNMIQCGILADLWKRVLEIDTKVINFNDGSKTIQHCIDNSSWYFLLQTLMHDGVVKKIARLPSLVGIAATGCTQFLVACKLAELLRRVSPDTKFVLGGSCVDVFMNSQYQPKIDVYKYFDYLIVGEGEQSICRLYRFLMYQDIILESIPNLFYVKSNGDIARTSSFLEDVESLPLADYFDLKLDQYMAPRVILPYQASRGCHYGHCAFCNHDEKYRHNYRMKSAQKVVMEIRELSRIYHTFDFQFVDEAIRPDHFKAIVEQMEKYDDFKFINWFFYSRVSREYDALSLEKAYKNGCRMVMFGIETFIQRLLKFIKKGISAETSIYSLKAFHEAHIKTFAWMLCNLPSETVHELHEDINILEKHLVYIDGFHPTIFRLEINTDMYSAPEEYNITSIDIPLNGCFTSHNGNTIINRDEIKDVYLNRYLSLKLKYFFSSNRYAIYFYDEHKALKEC